MLIFTGYSPKTETSIVLQNTLLLIKYLEFYPYIKIRTTTTAYTIAKS